MNYSGIINCTIADGTGFRVSLFVSGCHHHCEGCQNKQTWDFSYGNEFTPEVEEILFDRLDKPYIKGLTLTGGDPLFSAETVLGVVKRFREKFGNTKDIWLYTGFKMDYIMEHGGMMKEVIDMCDYVVDGKFELSKKDVSIAFRGSTNQIIWEKGEDGEFKPSVVN